ncbi:MAG: tRNA guanosine(15) transglycosylase TgtA [Caldisphaera sp.]|jgi:7-cyano-7-deazaguanine tRNA-ribosyltransferase|uniref:tRNA guanosine(15) transglycosylase TgtA n=1 Tax=Caldisphaera sp. TaxID=2060322 RepID=UPI000CA95FE3|nr:MAG: tRNA guanosine(15) transglycosylase TgtA [Caldisphaera sp.]
MFIIKDFELAGRIGILKTNRGIIETPAFFPVIDPLKQDVGIKEIEEMGFNQIITNAYLSYKRFGEKVISEGIHEVLGFDKVIMTDSGAYQVLKYGSIDVNQETVMNFEKAIGSDIAVILDKPTGDTDLKEAEESVEETLKNAYDAVKLKDDKTIWVLPIQGGKYLNLVEKSARESSNLPFEMFAIGSPTVFLEKYGYNLIIDMIATAKKYLPPEKPLHLFGGGHPLIFPFAIAMGVDTFDSASYELYAKDDRYITDYGTEKLEDLEYFPCNCPVCSKYTPKDLMEMDVKERRKLLSIHNLYAIKKSINRTKQAIREGRLWEFLVEISRYRPEAQSALRSLSKHIKYMDRFNPKYKGNPRGLKFYGIENTWNPRIINYKSWVLTKYEIKGKDGIIMKPYRGCKKEDIKNMNLIYYAPYLGLIPYEICGLYPTAQFHYVNPIPKEVENELVNTIRAFIIKNRQNKIIKVFADKNILFSYSVGIEAEKLGVEVLWS